LGVIFLFTVVYVVLPTGSLHDSNIQFELSVIDEDHSLRVSFADAIRKQMTRSWDSGSYETVRVEVPSPITPTDAPLQGLVPSGYYAQYLHSGGNRDFMMRVRGQVDDKTGAPIIPPLAFDFYVVAIFNQQFSSCPAVEPRDIHHQQSNRAYWAYTVDLANSDGTVPNAGQAPSKRTRSQQCLSSFHDMVRMHVPAPSLQQSSTIEAAW
jgi:hypothetical protein